ncbi:MAG: hypothetical protein JWR26_756 [Pedosphaera sp.]|nr:hypothetical protein [Pedosphaera sp.]
MKMKKDKKKDQGLNHNWTGGGEVLGHRARAGAFRVKAGRGKHFGVVGDLTCCGQDARGPLGGRGLGGGRRVGGFGRLLGFGEKVLKTAGGIGLSATWTGDGVKWRERGAWVVKKAPLKLRISRLPTLIAGCRRLPPPIFRCVYFLRRGRFSGGWQPFPRTGGALCRSACAWPSLSRKINEADPGLHRLAPLGIGWREFFKVCISFQPQPQMGAGWTLMEIRR